MAVAFKVERLVGNAYRGFIREIQPTFRGDPQASRQVRARIKYYIRENPSQAKPEALAEEIRQIGKTIRRTIVQGRCDNEKNRLSLDIQPEHITGGTVHLPKVPQTTLTRSIKYVKKLFSKGKGSVSDDA